jgi:pimeloyl-ACP methyl ester carboxylesterase
MTLPSLVKLADGIAARVLPADSQKVMWLHGYTLDSSMWDELWQLLPGWSHLGPDLPGHGGTRWGALGENLPDISRRLGEMALDHGVRHLVALSFGTIMALQIAIHFPNSFASIVLAAPALGGGPQDRDVQMRYEELTRLYKLQGPGPHMRELWMQSPPNLFKGAESQPRLWRRLCEVIDRHAWSELDNYGMNALTNYPQREIDVKRIESPTLILLGEHELPAFKRCAELIRRSLPSCQRTYLPQTGHLCLLEAPSKVHTLIEAHLREHGHGS